MNAFVGEQVLIHDIRDRIGNRGLDLRLVLVVQIDQDDTEYVVDAI